MEQTRGRILNKGAMKNFLYILRGALAGVLLSVIAILLFAFILKTMNAPDGSILVVNMIVKILSVLMGTIVSLSKINGKGYLVGAATGLLYALISFAIFSLLKGDLTMLNSFWSEVLTAIAAGTISGILIMNIKRK